MQTVTRTFDSIGGDIQHFVNAYDERGELIDIIEIIEHQGHVTSCRSIAK